MDQKRTARISVGAAALATVALLAGSILTGASRTPVSLNQGDQVTVHCPVKSTNTKSNGGRDTLIKCPAGSPTPAPTATPTSTPTPTPTPTVAPTPTPSFVISNVASSNITQTGANISWSCSALCTGQVEYGKTVSYGSLSTPETSFTWSSHLQILSGLTPGTLYHFRTKSSNQAGASATSADFTFTTLGSTPTPTPTVGPTPTPSPTPAPTQIVGTRVTSVEGLKAALANNAISDIVVANGTYTIRGAGFQASNSLWIGSDFAGRTNPVTIRAETKWGVIFDGGGSNLGCISFEEGVHDQTWDGFVFANGVINSTGCITIGGYPGLAAGRNIIMRNFKILSSIRGAGTNTDGSALDHAIYVAQAPGGSHDFLFEDFSIDCSGGLDSGIQLYFHGQGSSVAAWDYIFRRFTINNAAQALLLWESSYNMTFEDGTITNSVETAVTYQHPTTGNILNRINSTGSGQAGLSAPNGTSGLTITDSSLH